MAALPLARFKVLDLTRARAGPTCACILGDWGADVIKVEAKPGSDGDDLSGARHNYDFQNLHRNKRSITLDLKQEDGQKLLYRLAERADVLVENYRPDVKHRLRIDYETLHAFNPRLVKRIEIEAVLNIKPIPGRSRSSGPVARRCRR